MTMPDHVTRATSPPRPTPGGAAYTVRRVPPAATVVSVRGELDAANAREFSDYALRHLRHTDQLILDLSAVDFIATEAFSMQHTVSVTAAGQGGRWILVPSAAVRRLLRICDPDGALPVAARLVDAVAALNPEPQRLLQLVAQAR